MFKSHINVECCNTVSSIQYIMKYIMKGSDNAVFHFQQVNNNNNNLNNNNINNSNKNKDNFNNNNNYINEVQDFRSARYICSNEGIWRILSLPLHERYPTVVSLSIHLENVQRVYFNEHNLAHRLAHPPVTTLTAFFLLCNTDLFAKTLLYLTSHITIKNWSTYNINPQSVVWS